MKRKQITRAAFMDQLHSMVYRDHKPDYEKSYKLKGGYGFMNVVYKLFVEELNRFPTFSQEFIDANSDGSVGLKFGFKVTKCFIAGIGVLELEHDTTYDNIASLEDRNEIIGGLPECCYSGRLYTDNGDSIGVLTTLMDAPFEDVEGLIENMKIELHRMQEKLNEYLKELQNIR